jgi:hypothetical protein
VGKRWQERGITLATVVTAFKKGEGIVAGLARLGVWVHRHGLCFWVRVRDEGEGELTCIGRGRCHVLGQVRGSWYCSKECKVVVAEGGV